MRHFALLKCGLLRGVPLLAAASGVIACGAGSGGLAPEESEGAAATRQALGAEPAPTLDGSSQASEELAFIPRLGFLDGTTCESWPRRVAFDAQAANGADPLDDIISRYRSGQSSADAVRQVRDALDDLDIDSVTAIGSKHQLIYDYAAGMGATADDWGHAIIDTAGKKAYAMDAQHFCTQGDVEANRCSTRMVDYPGGDVELLVRNSPRDTVPAVMIVAPQIRVPDPTTMDVNAIWVTDKLIGGILLSNHEDLSERDRYAHIAHQPYLSKEDWRTYVDPDSYRRGLFVIIAGEIGGFQGISTSPAAPRRIIVQDPIQTPTFGDGNTLRLRPADILPIDGGVSWGLDSDDIQFVDDINGYVKTRHLRRYRATLPFVGLPETRLDGGRGGAAIVIAGETHPDFEVEAFGADAPSIEIDMDAMHAYVATLFGDLDALTHDHAPHVHVAGWHCANVTNDSPWAEEYCPEGSTGRQCSKFPWGEPAVEVCLLPQLVDYRLGDWYAATQGTTGTGNFQQALDGYQLAFAIRHRLEIYFVGSLGGTPQDGIPGTAERLLGAPEAFHAAHVISRGLYFDQLFNSAEDISLRKSIPEAALWTRVAGQSSAAVLFDPLRAANATEAQLDDNFGIQASRWRTAQGWGRYVSSSLAENEQKLNALGLPYGHVTTGWQPFTAGPDDLDDPQSFLDIERRWGAVADLVEDLNAVAQTQRTETEIEEVSDRLDGVIDAAEAFIGDVGSVSDVLASAAHDNISSQEQALSKLQATLEDVSDHQEELESSTRQIWGCVGQDYSVCVSNMEEMLQTLEQQCLMEGMSGSYFGAILGVMKTFVPYVATAVGAIEVVGLDDAIGDAYQGTVDNLDDIESALGTIDDARKAVESVVEKLQPRLEDSRRIAELVRQGLPHCGDTSLRDTARARLQQLALLNGVMQLYASDVQTLQGTIDSIIGHLQHLLVTQGAFQGLKERALDAQAELATFRGAGEDLISDQDVRRGFLRAACHTTLAAHRSLQADLYHVSQSLQSSTGQAFTEPSLFVPPQPSYLNIDNPPLGRSFSYQVSLWEPERFARRLADDGSAVDNFMALARGRYQRFWNEVCDPSVPSLPQARFVIRKVLSGEQLEALRAEGSAGLSVSLEDVIQGGNAEPHSLTAIAAASGAEWERLSAPVVLDVRYSACNGPAEDPCCATCRGPIATAPFLVKHGEGIVPTLTCEPTELSVSVAEPVHARARTCLQPVRTPRRAFRMTHVDTGLPDQALADVALDAVCQDDITALDWAPQRGLPAIGPWTVARDDHAATQVVSGGEVTTGSFPADVTALEIAFVVAAEPAHGWSNREAYALDPCVEEIENGFDDDCDGIIDNGLLPDAMAFEFTGAGAGWTTTGGVIGMSTSNVTEGQSALFVSVSGNAQLSGPPFMASELKEVGEQLLLDVFLDGAQPDPHWLGDINLYVSVPSANINQRYLGYQALTGRALDGWNTLAFDVPSDVRQVLLLQEASVRFGIAVNTPAGAPPLLLDNLRFAKNLTLRFSGAPKRGSLQGLFSFEDLSGWRATGGTLALDTTLQTHGAASLRLLRTSDYTTVASAEFFGSELGGPRSRLKLDVYAGEVPPWGAVQLRMQCPLFQEAWVGQQPLGALAPGSFTTVTFELPAGLQQALQAVNSECSIVLAISAPRSGTYQLDNIRLE